MERFLLRPCAGLAEARLEQKKLTFNGSILGCFLWNEHINDGELARLVRRRECAQQVSNELSMATIQCEVALGDF